MDEPTLLATLLETLAPMLFDYNQDEHAPPSGRPPAMGLMTTPSARRSGLLVSLFRLVDMGPLRAAFRPIVLHPHPTIVLSLCHPVLRLIWDHGIVITVFGLLCLLFLFIILPLARLLMRSSLPDKEDCQGQVR